MPVEFEEEIAWRAENGWPLNTVPYSMTSIHWNNDDQPWDDGYRPDCSGFASMCLGLPTPGPSTVYLVAHVHPIPWSGIRRGSLVMLGGPGTGGASGHVGVIAAVYPKMKTYDLIEQSGGWGPDRNRYRIGESSRPGMVPYRSNYLQEEDGMKTWIVNVGTPGRYWTDGHLIHPLANQAELDAAIARGAIDIPSPVNLNEHAVPHPALPGVFVWKVPVPGTGGGLTFDDVVRAVNTAEDTP